MRLDELHNYAAQCASHILFIDPILIITILQVVRHKRTNRIHDPNLFDHNTRQCDMNANAEFNCTLHIAY